jgi:hypothetical protein
MHSEIFGHTSIEEVMAMVEGERKKGGVVK